MAELIYVASIARSLENTLLGSDKITRLVFAESFDAALKILAENGFGNAGEGVDAMIAAEEQKLARFMKEAEGIKGLDSFSLRNDYHNAKALMKAKYGGIAEPDFMLAPAGKTDVEELKECVMNDDYAKLPLQMAKALAEIDVHFATAPHSGRYIDEVLDKAMYAHVLEASKKAGSIEKYWQIEIDHANVQIFLRGKKHGMRMSAGSFIPGGTIGTDFFAAAEGESEEAVLDKLCYTSVAKSVKEYLQTRSFARFEACKDNAQLQMFAADRYDLFSVAPVAGYYVAKKTELKAVKMILTLLKINADKALIKERLRDFYV